MRWLLVFVAVFRRFWAFVSVVWFGIGVVLVAVLGGMVELGIAGVDLSMLGLGGGLGFGLLAGTSKDEVIGLF